MAHTIDFEEAQIYVGTYAKYNDGSIFGKWLQVSDYSDRAEFYEACAALHNDEEDAEYMFQDWENIPDGMISECSVSDALFQLGEQLGDLSKSEREAFFIWCANNHTGFEAQKIDELIEDFQQSYCGAYESEEDFAYEHLEQTADLPEFALKYFDYEKYATDLFIDAFWFSDGHVFDR